MVAVAKKTNSRRVEKTGKNIYSPYPLIRKNPERQILIEDAYQLVKSQNDSKLPVSSLENAVASGKIKTYNFGGKQYLDRLDIGRVYHKKKDETKGMKLERCFSKEGKDPFDVGERYTRRNLLLKGEKSEEVVFEIENAEFPESWTDNEARIVAQKYFFRPNEQKWKNRMKKKIGVEYEDSIKHLIKRVSSFFAQKGWKLGFFETEKDRDIFEQELIALQIQRRGAFNSPAYFNTGIYNEYGIKGPPSLSFVKDPKTGKIKRIKDGCYIAPQNHACFIRGPTDDLVSILTQTMDEGSIFSAGSGCGGDIGALRELGAKLGGGGKTSGPLSFMEVFDRGAGSIKSGGKSRRAARMQTMRQNHPDVQAFVMAKVGEDKKALTLLKAGYSGGMDGEAYTTVAFQNTNLSVRLNRYFFEQVEKKEKIQLIGVKSKEVVGELDAEDLLKRISFGSWRIGDPGVQYDDPIQEWLTCPNSGRSNATNPCGEYINVDDTACNLASLNLLKFSDEQGNLDVKNLSKACKLITLAQEIANKASSYPIRDVASVNDEFKAIGLGFTNLGALLMRKGLAYDSDEGRAYAAAIAAVMTGNAYENSANMAKNLGTFSQYEFNRKPMLNIIRKHKSKLEEIAWEHIPENLKTEAFRAWKSAENKGKRYGFKNSQVTVLAPTGTISSLMGCATTGIEPSTNLVIKKNLAGGGTLILVNKELPNALNNLGYASEAIEAIKKYTMENGSLVGCPDTMHEHRDIFATSFGGINGEGAIPFEAHIKMVAAVQPFISGGISKTMNVPENATVKKIYDGFKLGNKLGLKGLTIFRSNSKPISALGDNRSFKEPRRGEKVDLATKRDAKEFEIKLITAKGKKHPIHLLVSEYPNGKPGQIAFLAYKSGSSVGDLSRITGISTSGSLKRGVIVQDGLKGWLDHEFEPYGAVYGHKYIKSCKSLLDMAAKIVLLEYTGDRTMAEDPNSVDITELRGFNNGAFWAYDREKVDDWDFKQVMKDHLYGGFVPQPKDSIMGVPNHKIQQEEVIPCPSCEGKMRRISSNCYSCDCGYSIGGCSY